MNETPKRKIGRGLKELLNENQIDDIMEGEVILDIPIEDMTANPFQPRRIFKQEKINELAKSIKEHGVFQPIIVKKTLNGYIIVSGERRYRASKQLKLKTVPAIVRPYDEARVAEIALMENLQREDLTPIEEAEAYVHVMQQLKFTQKELADRIGKSRSHVTNMIGLLNLPKRVQDHVLSGDISMGHARVLSKLKDPNLAESMAIKIMHKQLSVRQTESLASGEARKKTLKRVSKSDLVKMWEKNVKEKLALPCEIRNHRLIISAGDEETLKALIEKVMKL